MSVVYKWDLYAVVGHFPKFESKKSKVPKFEKISFLLGSRHGPFIGWESFHLFFLSQTERGQWEKENNRGSLSGRTKMENPSRFIPSLLNSIYCTRKLKLQSLDATARAARDFWTIYFISSSIRHTTTLVDTSVHVRVLKSMQATESYLGRFLSHLISPPHSPRHSVNFLWKAL